MKPLAYGLLLGGLLLVCPAVAQSTYCPIIPMPKLPGGGGDQAIVKAIQQRITYPPRALRAGATSRVFISFTITPAGRVQQVFVVNSFRRDCALAVVSAVRRLPRFEPRPEQYGNVNYVVPITFNIAGIRPVVGPPSRREFDQAHEKAFLHRNPKP